MMGSWIWLMVFLVLAVQLMLAVHMSHVAEQKGHTGPASFWLVMLFGIAGMLYVVALPDLVARQQREDLLALLLTQPKKECED